MARYVILSIDSFDYIENKTGNMLIRYKTSEVVAVIDPSKQGLFSQDVIGVGGKIPVVSSFNDTKQYKPDTLVIGNAPQAGKITEEMKSELISALSIGVDVISGMHDFLSTDKELLNIAKKNKAKIIDLRKPPSPPHFPEGTWKNRSVPVLLVVGSDCDTGKMTTAWEIKERLSAYNKNIEFIGTGQTGILLSKGVAIDAVVADFTKWIAEGAYFPSNVPVKANHNWWELVVTEKLLAKGKPVRQAVDHYVGEKLKADNVKPVAAADDSTYIRRVTLDLAGRIPTAPEVQDYVQSSEPNKKTRLVDRLLASESFHRQQVAEFIWLLNNGRDDGFRGYLEKAFADNRSWDNVFKEIILAKADTEAVMGALKASRAYTGRAKIAKVEGAYHGQYDYACLLYTSDAADE